MEACRSAAGAQIITFGFIGRSAIPDQLCVVSFQRNEQQLQNAFRLIAFRAPRRQQCK
jgi:hypothetical protein